MLLSKVMLTLVLLVLFVGKRDPLNPPRGAGRFLNLPPL